MVKNIARTMIDVFNKITLFCFSIFCRYVYIFLLFEGILIFMYYLMPKPPL